MSDTMQRLKDLIEIADQKEVKLLANIVKDYVSEEQKSLIGFKTDLGNIGGGADDESN